MQHFQTDDARWALKRATDPVHQALDERLSALDLTDARNYATFLRINARAMLPVEAALVAAGAAGAGVEWNERRRTDALLADLAGLGISPPPPVAVEPIGGGRAGLLGTLYVLEGSRLGGMILARRAAGGGEAVRSNMRFLDHGAGARLWPRFVAHLDALATGAGMDAATAAALEAFAAFDRAMAAEGMADARRAA